MRVARRDGSARTVWSAWALILAGCPADGTHREGETLTAGDAETDVPATPDGAAADDTASASDGEADGAQRADAAPDASLDVPSDDAAAAVTTPVLQRAPATPFHACTAVDFPGFTPPGGTFRAEYAETTRGLFLVTEAQSYDADAWRYWIAVHPAASDHTFGGSIFASGSVTSAIGALDTVGGDGELALAWQPWLNTTRMSFARLAVDGAALVAPKELPGTLGATQRLRLLALPPPGDGGSRAAFIVVWLTYAGTGWTPVLMSLALDAAGDPLSEATTLVGPEDVGNGDVHFDARPTDDGVLLIWERATDRREVRLARFDARGHRVGEVTTLSPPGIEGAYPTLAPRRKGGWLAAWNGWPSIGLAKIDAGGQLEGAAVALGPGPDTGNPAPRTSGQPVLAPSGDVMALAWAMPDDMPIAGEGNSPLTFVLLEPETLAPASQVMTVGYGGDGRLTHVRVVADGLRFQTTYGVAFHAGSGHGAVDFECPVR